MKKRLLYPDIAKGLGMMLIVLGHNSPPRSLEEWISTFHVPLFFIISGYFFKIKGIRQTLLDGWKQLLLPMLMTGVMCSLALILLFSLDGTYKGPRWNYYIETTCLINQYGYLAMWFLGALFIGKLAVSCLFRLAKSLAYVILLALLLFILVWIIPFDARAQVPIYFLCNGCMSAIFILIGFVARQKGFFDYNLNLGKVLIILLFIGFARFPVSFVKCIMPYGIYNILLSSIISVFVIYICKQIETLKSNPIRVIGLSMAWYGRYSLVILAGHALLHAVITPRLPLAPGLLIGSAEVIALGIAPMVCRFIPILRDIYFVGTSPFENMRRAYC